jgi:4-hydroxybenzoate polyprenyltransferase
MASRLRALRLVHPFPSLLNAALVAALAGLAGGSATAVGALALGMLGIQFSIGTVNDLVDVRRDAAVKPWKPIPSGAVSAGVARGVAIAAAAFGLAAAASQGWPVAALAIVMLICGLAYDLWLKPTPLAWLCFAVAFAILPVYAWFGASGVLPPRAEFLIPLAAMAGPALQLSNSLVDLERDSASGLPTLATRLGPRATLMLIAALLVVIYGIAWLTLTIGQGSENFVTGTATVCALAGFALQTRGAVAARQVGWTLEAMGIALLGVGWLWAVA